MSDSLALLRSRHILDWIRFFWLLLEICFLRCSLTFITNRESRLIREAAGLWGRQSEAKGTRSVAAVLFVNSEPSLALSLSISCGGTFWFSPRASQWVEVTWHIKEISIVLASAFSVRPECPIPYRSTSENSVLEQVLWSRWGPYCRENIFNLVSDFCAQGIQPVGPATPWTKYFQEKSKHLSSASEKPLSLQVLVSLVSTREKGVHG